jgi:hypothetical protein
LDEVKVTLVLEIEKDSNSVLRFKRDREEGGLIESTDGAVAIGPTTRVLVPRPASLTQSSCEESVDVRAAVSIVLDMVGAEVVLQDVTYAGMRELTRELMVRPKKIQISWPLE